MDKDAKERDELNNRLKEKDKEKMKNLMQKEEKKKLLGNVELSKEER